MTSESEVYRRTYTWLREIVVGLNLCPFARDPLDKGALRVAISRARSNAELVEDLWRELDRLLASEVTSTETTLLVHPYCLSDFDAYNEFLEIADLILRERELEGVIQIASFHPNYQFIDADPDAPENFTNRSPYPMLHLLREDSVTRAVEGHPDPEQIPHRNVDVMRSLDRSLLERGRRGERVRGES